DRLDDPPVSISRHLQQAADLLRCALVAEELLLALPDGRVLECESARAAEGDVQGGGEEARHGEVLHSFRVAGRFAARSDWQADLGDFEREVDRDVRTIALDDQGGAGADGEARRPIGEQGGHQARRDKASAGNFPSMTRRYRRRLFAAHSLESLRVGLTRRYLVEDQEAAQITQRGGHFGPRLNFWPDTNPLKVVQTPALIVILSQDLTYRQIFLDG